MPESSLAQQVEKVALALRDLMQFQARVKPVVPKDMERLRRQVEKLHPSDHRKAHAHFDLFHRIGSVLMGRETPPTMGELSKALSVPVSTATRMVDWQVAKGYVKRLADLHDRRIVRLAVTPDGRRLLRTLDAFLKERIERVLRRFPAKERDQIVALIRGLIDTVIETE